MRKFLVLVLLAILLLGSCENPSSSDTTAESISIIPIVGFNTPIRSGRMTVPIDTESEQSLASYTLMGPLITSFESVSDYTEDTDYSIALFDSFMDFTITLNDDSSITYTGTMQDDSGNMTVTYDEVAGTFSFEQILYLDATASDVSQMELAMYVTGSNLTIDSDGYFQGIYDVAYIQKNNDDSWILYTHSSEIYRGIMNSTGSIGIGITYCGDADADGTDGLRWFESADSFTPSDYNSGMTIPAEVSISTLSDWKAYLSSDETLSLDSDDVDNHPSRWDMYYKFDDGDISSVDGLDSSTYSAGFTSDADLSTWRDSSLLLSYL
ncbi:MAG: hypothetical protein PQJ59_04870 [Spirochaetales bacterium]|nr:hypothetical protein [Spirochaetales bacterium]